MAGLVFAEDLVVDPGEPLLGFFDQWLEVTAARTAASTLRGYTTDVGTFAAALADVVGKPPAPDTGEAEMSAAATAAWGKALPPATYRRGRLALAPLVLADMAPRNCARALDTLGAARSAASTRRLASAWSSFARLLVRRGLLAANPMDADVVERPRKPAHAPSPLDYGDAAAMLAVLRTTDPASRWPWPGRDFALAAVLLSTGLRVSEACTVRVGDVRALDHSPRIVVVGKGSKPRTVPLHPATLHALTEYGAQRESQLGRAATEDALFVKANGAPFTPRSMRHLVERWYARARVPRIPGACVHALRHTFATAALDSGANVLELQKLLGHTSLDTTSAYLKVVGSGLEDAIAAHPAGAMIEAATHPGRP